MLKKQALPRRSSFQQRPAWTTPRTWVSGELVTASMMNTHVRDNLNYLFSVSSGADILQFQVFT